MTLRRRLGSAFYVVVTLAIIVCGVLILIALGAIGFIAWSRQ